MRNQPVNHDAILRVAQFQRGRALARFWTRVVDLLSPRLPRIFPAEF